MHDAPLQPVARLLLVDDSPQERLALAHILRSIGYQVDEAGDGDAAIDAVKRKAFDLVLLDLHMPHVDGFTVLAYLQEHHAALPTILLSGMPANQIQHELHRLPSHALPPLLIKPVDPEQLLGVIELQLSGELPAIENRAPIDSAHSV